MFALRTVCSIIILINLACLAPPTTALAVMETSPIEANKENSTQSTTEGYGVADTTKKQISGSMIDQLTEAIESNFTTTTTVAPTTTTNINTDSNYFQVKCKARSEIYSNCTNSCPASCEDPQRKPCRTFCWSGCECAPGYVKNFRWQCISIEDCPKCGPNEHYRNCGTGCEPTCDTYQNLPVYCSNKASCKRGCFCDYGFVRDMNKNGTCVPIAECPQKCGPNEYWDVNGEPCIRSAENPRPKCLFETPKASCVCNTGFRRNPETKQCEPVTKIVLSEQRRCGANQTFSYCGSECALNCFDENKRHMCSTICHRGCFCNEGYRRESSGRCVLPDDCRQWTGNGYETRVVVV